MASTERDQPDVELSPDATQGLKNLMENEIYNQLRTELGNTIPDDISFIFGHTHKPFQRKMKFNNYANEVKIFNSGGWVVDTMNQQSLIGGSFHSGLWFKDGRSFINVREARDADLLQGVRIYEFDAAFRLRQVTEAERGEYAGDGKWRLVRVAQTKLGPGGPTVAHHEEADWRSAVSPDLLNVLIVSPERMSAQKLYLYLQHLTGNRQKSGRYEIALWKKLFYPLAALVMMALALPFAYMHARSGMVGFKVFLGIMLGIFFHMLNSLFSHVGLLNEWPPMAVAALPSLLFLATAILMMVWIERLRPVWARLRA
jgi:lipopolysaccharide export system permease protein